MTHTYTQKPAVADWKIWNRPKGTSGLRNTGRDPFDRKTVNVVSKIKEITLAVIAAQSAVIHCFVLKTYTNEAKCRKFREESQYNGDQWTLL